MTREPKATGAELVLESAGREAVVTETGAALRSWRVEGRELLDTFAVDEPGDDFRGSVLAPWPNRIRDGRYAFAGSEHRVAISEPERRCALHGLVLRVEWRPIGHGSDHVTLEHVLEHRQGYPFSLALQVEYRLAVDGLAVTLRATNLGAAAAPFGAGFHPYLRLGDGRIDDYVLELPARTRVPVDERLLPRGAAVGVDDTDHDFRGGRSVGRQALDTCFGDLDRGPDGLARVRLTGADGAQTVTAWMDERFQYVHVYTADAVTDPARRRRGIAIEPMTCAPDAFNSGAGLVTVPPGASFTCRWGLSTPATPTP